MNVVSARFADIERILCKINNFYSKENIVNSFVNIKILHVVFCCGILVKRGERICCR